jgi:hypothetical protein
VEVAPTACLAMMSDSLYNLQKSEYREALVAHHMLHVAFRERQGGDTAEGSMSLGVRDVAEQRV